MEVLAGLYSSVRTPPSTRALSLREEAYRAKRKRQGSTPEVKSTTTQENAQSCDSPNETAALRCRLVANTKLHKGV